MHPLNRQLHCGVEAKEPGVGLQPTVWGAGSLHILRSGKGESALVQLLATARCWLGTPSKKGNNVLFFSGIFLISFDLNAGLQVPIGLRIRGVNACLLPKPASTLIIIDMGILWASYVDVWVQ